jgi:uncharacterized protein (UPF0261 family)
MAIVVLLGTLDTKGAEYAFLRERIEEAGCDVISVNAGVLGDPDYQVEYGRNEVARAAGADLAVMERDQDRGASVTTMARGAAVLVAQLHAQGRLHGILGAGGSGGSSIIGHALQSLPVGVPKMLVSTMGSGDVRPYVGAADIAMMYSVVDIAGINAISSQILGNAGAAIAGMARAYEAYTPAPTEKPLIGASMYGTTTPCVEHARGWLEAAGYEVLVFHATGTGGRSMEALMKSGHITGSLDITTTELVDELAGGTLTAGPDRLEMAGALGLPQVVSLGGVDQITFTPPDSVPSKYRDRKLYAHNPTVTLMRSNPEENARLGRVLSEKLNRAAGPVTLFIPLRGMSQYGAPGGVFHDPVADEALVSSLEANLDPEVEVIEIDTDINDPDFAVAMAKKLDEHYRKWAQGRRRPKKGEEGVAGRDSLVTGTTRG